MNFPLELFGRVLGVRGKFVDRAFVWGICRRAQMGSDILADITRFRMCPLVFQLRTSIIIPGCCGVRALVMGDLRWDGSWLWEPVHIPLVPTAAYRNADCSVASRGGVIHGLPFGGQHVPRMGFIILSPQKPFVST
jgi:hypothetical protein